MSVLKGEGKHPILFGTVSVPVRTRTHTAYSARPDLQGAWPTVMVVGGAAGLTPPVRDICRRLARHGFAAIAPDLYAGKPPKPDVAAMEFAGADRAPMRRILTDIGRVLLSGAGPWDTAEDGFGVLGVQEGARLAVETAVEFASPLALVAPNLVEASPGLDSDGNELEAPPGAVAALPGLLEPIMGIVGRDDSVTSLDQVHEAREAAPHSQWVLYPALGHDYWNDNADGFDLSGFTDTMDRLIEFFNKSL